MKSFFFALVTVLVFTSTSALAGDAAAGKAKSALCASCHQDAAAAAAESVHPGEMAGVARQGREALRCNIARQLLGESSRGFSARLADSPLLQGFCGIARLDVIQVPSKSTVDRHGKLVDEQTVRKVIDRVSRAAAQPAMICGITLSLTGSVSVPSKAQMAFRSH